MKGYCQKGHNGINYSAYKKFTNAIYVAVTNYGYVGTIPVFIFNFFFMCLVLGKDHVLS